jgi:hypothetical protein
MAPQIVGTSFLIKTSFDKKVVGEGKLRFTRA